MERKQGRLRPRRVSMRSQVTSKRGINGINHLVVAVVSCNPGFKVMVDSGCPKSKPPNPKSKPPDIVHLWYLVILDLLIRGAQKVKKLFTIWVWVNTYRYIFSGMNIHKSQLFWG